MPKIDESRMKERPEGVTEAMWRAKLEYEAVQAAHAKSDAHPATETNDEAKQAADAVLGHDTTGKKAARR